MLGRYGAVALQAFRRRLTSPTELTGRLLLFALILTIWWKIWQATAFGGFAGFAPADALWYLMATEWIVLSIPYAYLEIEAEIRSGDFAYSLLRPGSYAGYHVAQAAGLGAANWAALGATGVVVAFVLTGHWPAISAGAFAGVGVLGLCAVLATTLVMVTLGLVAVWTQDASPCAWVWQKLQFVLGGLMLPLSLYPAWLRRVAEATPFPVLLGDPAVTMLHGTAPGAPLTTLMHIGAVATGFALVLAWVFRRAVRKIQEG